MLVRILSKSAPAWKKTIMNSSEQLALTYDKYMIDHEERVPAHIDIDDAGGNKHSLTDRELHTFYLFMKGFRCYLTFEF